MRHRRKVVSLAVLVALIPAIVEAFIKIDGYLIDREQRMEQAEFDREVRDCEREGGRWVLGDCQQP